MSIADDVTATLTAAAHEYRSRGWRVIQLHKVGPDGKTCSCQNGANCTSAGKHPIDKEWQKSAPMSGADIEEAWTGWKAKANIGLATGTESGFWVLDLDPKDDGVENFRTLLAGRPLPATYVVQTGSGGYHYYFAMPEGVDIRNTQGRIAKGVDTRASGGQVVAAPSVTDKGVYTVVKDVPVAYAPSWLLDLVKKADSPADIVTAEDLPKPADLDPAEWDRLNAYARKVIDAELERLDKLSQTGWDGEPWDATTFQASCSLLEIANSPWNAYSVGQAEQDVLAHAPRDNEGFDTWKVKQKFSSAREKVGDKARPVPVSRQQPADLDLFAGPDVRGRQNPTQGDGAPTTPVVGNGPESYFDKAGVLSSRLARDVMALGPVGFGQDKDFWVYQGGVWVPDENVVEYRMIDLLGDRYRKALVPTIESVVAKSAVPIIADEPHVEWMNFSNGMLNWATGELLEHDANFKSTVQFPVPYDPTAECPTFDQFLDDVMHEDYVYLAWQMLGYLMLSGNPLQVAFLFYGSGGNGKGTLMRVIEDLLGRQNVAAESLDDLNGNRFAAINLYGRIANLAGDIDATYQESTANFKKLTGEDTYSGEKKFGNRFNFKSWAVPVFSANKIPGSSDVTEGYLRRWVILHFHKRITNMIPGFSDRLSQELPGIAAKALRHLPALMQNKAFDIKGEATKGKDEFALQIDQVRQWIASGQPIPAPEHHCPLADLYAGYRLWADRSGQGRLRESEFSHRLEAIGYAKSRLGGVVGHTGLRVEMNQHVNPSVSTFF